MNTLQVVFIVGVLLAIAGTLGITWAVFRTSAAAKTIELYQAENEVMGKMNHRLETEVTRLQTKVDTQQASMQALQETVTQRADVAQLMTEIRKAEHERREEHQVQMALMKDVIGQIKEMRGLKGERNIG